MKKTYIFVFVFMLIGCQSTQYRPVVDPNSGKAQEVVNNDILECTEIARTVNLSDATMKSGMMGAAVGGGVAAGVSVAVAGAVTAIAVPYVVAATMLGGGIGSGLGEGEELEARKVVLNNCLKDRGYKVYSE
jgi:hypothetical protein